MDRWLEIDIDWFGPPPCGDRIQEFVDRVAPLLHGVTGDRGVILNVGWLADIVTEWTGDAAQRLPLRSRRYERWADTSYADLREFVSGLRERLAAAGVPDARVGLFIAGPGHVVLPEDTGELYDLYSDWSERHPELYPLDLSRLPGPDLDPRVPLHADDFPYASHPEGVTEGMSFGRLLADQWGALARFAGLDAIHLRDGFWGPLLYSRKGPYGTMPSADPEMNQSWTTAVAELFAAVKAARPEATVMAYSSGVSQTAEWRVGCVDLEQVVAAGGVDVFIDQTWGGAWQDWWDDHWKGWTFQLANLLGHGVPLRRANRRRVEAGIAPCRHYKLIETWDGWEPWDTIHRTRGKLEWAIWAFSHAAVVDGERLHVPEGTYISWMNDWDLQLLPAEDVRFLATGLDQAEASARELDGVVGPVMVVNHDDVDAHHRADPQGNASEWIEDQVAMAMKAGVPVLAASDRADLARERPEGWIVQLPASTLPARHPESGPLIGAGRFDLVDGGIGREAGLVPGGEPREAGYVRDSPSSAELTAGDSVHLPNHVAADVEDDTAVVYRGDGAPLLAGRRRSWAWQPPDLNDPADPQFPRNQLGSSQPYWELAAVLQRESQGLRVTVPSPDRPVAVHAWRSGGRLSVLVGNLETGWVGDSRGERRVELLIPESRLGARADSLVAELEPSWTGGGDVVAEVRDGALLLTIGVAASGMALIRLRPRPALRNQKGTS